MLRLSSCVLVSPDEVDMRLVNEDCWVLRESTDASTEDLLSKMNNQN